MAASASAYYGCLGLGELGAAAWIAPIPVLIVAFRTAPSTAALVAFSAYFLGSLNLYGYLAGMLPVAIVVLALTIPAAAFVAAVLAARYAHRTLAPPLAVFGFPCAWTAYEFLQSRISPHGTFFSLGYSQTDFLPVLQIASVAGIFGVVFVVTLVPSAVAVAWNRRSLSALVPTAAVAVAVLGYGTIRLQHTADGPGVPVGMAVTDRSVGTAFATEDPSVALAVAHGYADRIVRLGAQGARVIVLPEKFVGVTPGDQAEVAALFAAAARAARATVIVGLNRVAIEPPRNVAVVFGPDGRVITEYDKHHMLPGPETGYRIGRSPGLFAAGGTPWGVAICKDMDFPSWLRGYGRSGVRILAVPAWDFVVDGRLHSRMAVVRGVENGFAIARAAQQGLLTFSDANGRILAEGRSGRAPEVLLMHELTPGPGSTLYTRFGDWFGWTVVAGFMAIMAAGYRRSRNKAVARASTLAGLQC